MPHPPFIILDDSSGQPLYRQIYETIRRSILSGEFLPGKLLPATRYLAKELGISRMTVINAYDQLTAEGYLESKKGAGTFVAEHLPEEFLNTPRLKPKNQDAEIKPRRNEFSAYGKIVSGWSEDVLIFNRAAQFVPFQHGLAAVDEFPFDVWMKLSNKVYRTIPKNNFGYGDAAGFFPLRESIAAHLKSVRAVNCTPEQVIITCGAQHSFDLIGRIFLKPKTKVWIENPCYFGVKQSFQSFDAKFIPVPVDKNGFNLTAALEQDSQARLAYVTPSHQFPLGVTMSLQRRLELLEWANKSEAFIVEDDYDSEFRYEGRPLPSLQGLDRAGRVLYVGTFSKTIFPALKIGCVVVPPDLIDVFTAVRALSGAQAAISEQATLAEFIAEGHFGRHLRRMRRLYESRQDVLVSELKKHLEDRLDVKSIISGMHVIGWLPEKISDLKVCVEAAKKGVKATPLSKQYLTEPERGGLILGYTAFGEKEIKSGVKRLTAALKNFDKN